MNVTAYALSVFVVIVLSAVADLMLPDGRTKKTAKAVFSLLITLTLISPAISLIKGDTPVFDFETQYISIDYNLVEYVGQIAKNDYESEIFELLKNSGYDGIEKVECFVDGENRRIIKVVINYDKSGIKKEDEHTYISGIKTAVVNYYHLNGEAVTVCGE